MWRNYRQSTIQSSTPPVEVNIDVAPPIIPPPPPPPPPTGPVLVSNIASFSIPRSGTKSIAGNFTNPTGGQLTFGLATGTLPSGVTLSATGVFAATAGATLGTSGDLMVYADDGLSSIGNRVASFTLTTTAASGTYPFTIGHGFGKGDVPASIALDIPSVQVVIKRTWSDGSVKHAIISGHVALVQNVAKTITITRGTVASGTNLTSVDIAAAAPAASIQCGSIGTVSLASLLASPFRTWISGPEMVECHYRAEVSPAVSRIAVWFHVRLFKNGRVWVRAICENGYLDNGAGAAATKVNDSYIPTIIIGGVTTYNNSGQAITHWSNTRYCSEGWIGGDPAITPGHDVTYLRGTKLVPNYYWRNPSSATLDALPQTYAPQTNGFISNAMGQVGFGYHIGVLPYWDAHFCASGDPRAYRAVLAGSSFLNSYTMVYRDFTTKEAIKPNSFQTWCASGPNSGFLEDLGSFNSGGAILVYDQAHSPSAGYLAYLLTGDFWHYETLALHASFQYLTTRVGSGLGTDRDWIRLFQVRGFAWATRTIGQYAAISPDGDAIAAEYRAWFVTAQNDWKRRIDLPGASQLGYPITTSTYTEGLPNSQPPWMFHFWMASNGHVSEIEPGLSAPDQATFIAVRDFMYRGVVGILGPNGASNYCFSDASVYYINTSAVVTNGLLDPPDLYQTWGEVYQGSFGIPNTSCTNILKGSSASVPTGPDGYWGNLMPAIAFAVDHGAPGAQTSWNRLTGASNWPGLRDSGFDNLPIWGITPRNWAG